MQAKALDFTRGVIAMAVADSVGDRPSAIIERRWPDARYSALIRKAAIGSGSVGGATWGSEIADLQPLADAFLEELRPLTFLGRMEGVRPAPFNIRFAAGTAAASAGWVGEASAIPITSMTFGEATMRLAKVGGIVVLTEELLRSTSPAAEAQIKLDLQSAIVTFTDAQIIDPTITETAARPASITNGTTPVAASDTTAEAAAADFRALVKKLTDAGVGLAAPYFLMSTDMGARLAGLDVQMFRDVGPLGGKVMGIPVLTTPGSGAVIALVDASEIALADEGLEIMTARQASVQMDTAPNQTPGTATNQVSLFQVNAVGVRALRSIRWRKRRAGAAAYISGAAYGDAA
ncbi:phage major capsid protein [Hansschlegelia sp. KR7-227]|uniref:phage major capsid protein n=1 Tax=Hansschlegelia sp. KR7-227 TaxID=3400914 RepID=UPI003C03F6B0